MKIIHKNYLARFAKKIEPFQFYWTSDPNQNHLGMSSIQIWGTKYINNCPFINGGLYSQRDKFHSRRMILFSRVDSIFWHSLSQVGKNQYDQMNYNTVQIILKL